MVKKYIPKDTRILTVFMDTETESGFTGASIAAQFCYLYGDDKDNAPQLFEGYECIEELMLNMEQLWRSLNKPPIRMYAHNATYDLMRFKNQLAGCNFKAVLVCGALIAGKLEHGEMVIECRDSLRLLPQSLSSLSESLAPHLPKLQLNHLIGYEIGNRDDQEYAKRDVTTLRAILLAFSEIAGITFEKLKFSAAGQAFSLVRKSYEEEVGKKYTAIKRSFNETIIKDYYYGGRIYIRHNHNPQSLSTCVSLDITSSYPTQMREQFFPIAGKKPRPLNYAPTSKGRYFVKCYVTDYKEKFPILPYREFNAQGEKLNSIYPNGSFVTHLTDMEYLWLKKNQREAWDNIEVLKCFFWDINDCSQWLKPYVDSFYKLKERGDILNEQSHSDWVLRGEKDANGKPCDCPKAGEALRTVAKLFLNSPYGKFAQKYIDDGGESVSWGDSDNLEVFGESNADHRNAHISAFITGGARVYLYDAIQYYGHENIVYVDTDSIKVLEDVYHSKPPMPLEGDYMGSWKPEGIYHNLQVIAPKVYIGEHEYKGKTKLEIKAKGLPMRGITGIQHGDNFKRFARSLTNEDQNKKVDKQIELFIQRHARNLTPMLVSYDHKPVKFKSFIRDGQYSTKSCKTMSYPQTVKGMVYNGNVYKIIEVNEKRPCNVGTKHL
jgi:hypothetical protein